MRCLDRELSRIAEAVYGHSLSRRRIRRHSDGPADVSAREHVAGQIDVRVGDAPDLNVKIRDVLVCGAEIADLDLHRSW